jgi:hypothetical protein
MPPAPRLLGVGEPEFTDGLYCWESVVDYENRSPPNGKSIYDLSGYSVQNSGQEKFFMHGTLYKLSLFHNDPKNLSKSTQFNRMDFCWKTRRERDDFMWCLTNLAAGRHSDQKEGDPPPADTTES